MSSYEELRKLDLAYCFHPSTILSEHHVAGRGAPIFVEGHGAYLKDIGGNEYLDFRGGGLVNCNLGYSDDEVARAAYDQMRKLHYATSFQGQSHEPLIRLSEKIASFLPPGLSRVLILNSGSESNEAAMKLARLVNRLEGRPQKVKIISRKYAFHGASQGTAPITEGDQIQNTAQPLAPGYSAIEAPYCYRCPFGKVYPSCGVACATELEREIERQGPETVAAFIAEPMGQRPGALVPPPEYWPIIRDICTKHSVFMIADEVITGLGRSGKCFALEHWGVWPDMLTLSKGLAAGFFPISAMVAKEEIYQRLLKARSDLIFWHGFTMSGNPTGCAVALKNIEIVERRGLIENARVMGKRLLDGLNSLRDLEIVGDVRGLGLFAGVELVKNRETKERIPTEFLATQGRTVDLARERGLLVRSQPTGGDLVTFAPPLIVTAEQVDSAVQTLRDCLKVFQDRFRSWVKA